MVEILTVQKLYLSDILKVTSTIEILASPAVLQHRKAEVFGREITPYLYQKKNGIGMYILFLPFIKMCSRE